VRGGRQRARGASSFSLITLMPLLRAHLLVYARDGADADADVSFAAVIRDAQRYASAQSHAQSDMIFAAYAAAISRKAHA